MSELDLHQFYVKQLAEQKQSETEIVNNSEFKKWDSDKPPLGWLPLPFLEQTVKVMQHGAKKYGKDNWKLGTEYTRYTNAALRHIYAWVNGEDNDKESGMSHLAHASCCLAFLMTMDEEGFGTDDR